MNRFFFSLIIVVMVLWAGCEKEPGKPSSVLQVSVKSMAGHTGLSAYIFLNDSLYGVTDENGNLSVGPLAQKNYTLICSAVYYRDTTVNVVINGAPLLSYEFILPYDSTMGRLGGEFQDMGLYRQRLIETPDLQNWSEKRKYDATTGATIQEKTFGHPITCYVLLDNDTIAVCDNFGQYWCKLQCGTYYIKGVCEGYSKVSAVITLSPDAMLFKNFYLEPL